MTKLRPVIRKVDANQGEIVAALRKLGYTVVSTAMVGKGFPDLSVGKDGVSYHIEVKDGSLPPSKRRLTADEQDFASSWRGHYAVLTSLDDVAAFHADKTFTGAA